MLFRSATYKATRPYIGQMPAHLTGSAVGTVAAIPAAEAALEGVPAAVTALKNTSDISSALRAFGAATARGSLATAMNPITWLGAAQLALAPYEAEQEGKRLQKNAELIKAYEDLETRKRNTLKELGLKPEEGFWDSLKKGFERAALFNVYPNDARGNM